MSKIYLIGIGYKPLDKKAQEIIYNSDVVIVSSRLFEVFKWYEEFKRVKDKVKIINNVDETINFIRSSILQPSLSLSIVLLASGDPMFFGIGRRIIEKFGKDRVEILPDLSSIQLAFSRIKEPWDDAFLMSLHGGPNQEKRRRLAYEIDDIPCLLQQHNKIAILTDKESNPAEIAKILKFGICSESSSGSKFEIIISVCERLGYPDEKITNGKPEEIAQMSFSDPNVVVLQILSEMLPPNPEARTTNSELKTQKIRFGLREDEISHSRGLITKDEIRAVTIHKLRMPHQGVFWDIGSGSGSVSIEIARLYPDLRIFAVEKDHEQINYLQENKERFNIANIKVIAGEAPNILTGLPSPDRVFIGGSNSMLKEIIGFTATSSCLHIVVNATTIETLNQAIEGLENNGFRVEVSEVSVARERIISGKRHLNALNPVFIITGEMIPIS